MAEFWEQQLMDRLLTLCFKFKENEKEVMPAEEVKDVMDYVRFVIDDKRAEALEKEKKK
jgi:hypothetical protein